MAKRKDKIAKRDLSSPETDGRHGSVKSVKPPRTVSSLTGEQLEKKRANDREAQRKIRERNKKLVEVNVRQSCELRDLENQVRRLEAENANLTEQCKVHGQADALEKIGKLQQEIASLHLQLAAVPKTQGVAWEQHRHDVPARIVGDQPLTSPHGAPHRETEPGGYNHPSLYGIQHYSNGWTSNNTYNPLASPGKQDASSPTKPEHLIHAPAPDWHGARGQSNGLLASNLPTTMPSLGYGQLYTSQCSSVPPVPSSHHLPLHTPTNPSIPSPSSHAHAHMTNPFASNGVHPSPPHQYPGPPLPQRLAPSLHESTHPTHYYASFAHG